MLLGDLLQGSFPAAGNCDLGARLGKGQSHIGTNATAATGNHHALIGQQCHIHPSPRSAKRCN